MKKSAVRISTAVILAALTALGSAAAVAGASASHAPAHHGIAMSYDGHGG